MEKIEFLSAILIVSKNADHLASFYRDVIGVPLETEDHGKLKRHYGCELGDLHFAIHPTENFPEQKCEAGSINLAFTTFDINALVKRIEGAGYKMRYALKDTGFSMMTAINDPDGNYVEFTQLTDRWFQYLETRKKNGIDVVQKWREFPKRP